MTFDPQPKVDPSPKSLFPTRLNAPVHVPAKVTRRWLVKQKLQENLESMLSLPVGPLIKLQYMMATSGKRWVWDDRNNVPVPYLMDVAITDGAGKPVLDDDGEPTMRQIHVALDAAEHAKLLDKLTERVLPTMKSMEMERLKDKELDPADQELSTHSTEELHERLRHLEGGGDEAEDPERADPS